MNNHEMFEIVEKQVCKEICQIAEQIQKTQSMTVQDLEKLDKLYHLKKDMLTAAAMEEAEEYSDGMSSEGGNSGYRGRAANGQYISRESRNSQSYADGYSQGYSEAMNQMNGGNSGHFQMYPPRYPRW